MKLTTYNKVRYFQSNLLISHNFFHAFFVKRFKKNEPIELQNQLDITSNIHFSKQVHGNKVIKIKSTSNLRPKTADSLITNEKNHSLWIYTADCIPILIADIKTRNIAACHSGLMGLRKQIISKTLKRLLNIGSKKKNLIIAIGPSIKGANYQVKLKDVDGLIVQITGKRLLNKNIYIAKGNKELIIPLFKKDPMQERLFFDLQAAAILQLYKEGITQSQISLNRLCTYSNPRLFNSYRRDSSNQRQWSCIYS